MLKAKRKTYGNTWWGRAWIEALERIDSNRLARGKSYANTGKVLSLSVQAGKVTAKIKGSFYDSYQVRIELTPFTKQEIVRLQALVAQQPSVSIELGLGILPASLLDLMQKENLILLPSRWKDMKSNCSCPDSSNPCKHLAAVYYVLANEIDQDPFLLFNLKGVETAKLVGLSAASSQTLAEVRENPLLSKWVAPAALNSIPESPIPAAFNFALPRHNIRPVLSLLTENPPFYTEGNFKVFLENLYHLVPAEVGLLFPSPNEEPFLANRLFQLEWFKDEYSPRHLFRLKISRHPVSLEEDKLLLLKEIQASQLPVSKLRPLYAGVVLSPSEPLKWSEEQLWALGSAHSSPAVHDALALDNLEPGLDYFLNASLTVDPNRASDSFLFLNLAASLSLALVSANLFVPEVLYENDSTFCIRYVPLNQQPAVEAAIAQLAAVMPRDLVCYRRKFRSQEGLSDLLALFITRLVHAVLSGQSIATENRVLKLFCEDYLFRVGKFTEKRIGPSISNWLEKLHLGKRDIAPVIRIEPKAQEQFLVFVDVINRKSALDAIQPFTALFGQPTVKKASVRKKVEAVPSFFERPLEEVRADVSRQLIIAAAYLAELKPIVDSEGQIAPVVSLERMSEILLETAGVLDVLGLDLILPKALKKLVAPNLQMKAKLRKSNERGASYLTLDEMLNFSYEIALGDEVLTPQAFRQLVKKTGGLVKFKDHYVLLRPDEVQSILKKLREPVPELSSPMQALYTAMAGEINGLQFHPDEAFRRVLDELTRVDVIEVPGNLNATLRPYQERGFRWLWTNSRKGFGTCLADDMGLGKTLQIITLLLHTKNEAKIAANKGVGLPSMVVCPTTLIGNWEKECARFAPELNVSIYHGTERRLALKDIDLLITSYGVFRRDLEKFTAKNWDFLVIDEAQNIKNSQTAQTKAIKALKAKTRIAMTGTPVENRLTELWNIFDFINPGYLGTLNHFKTELANPIEKVRDADTIEKLKRTTAPFMLRRLKSDKSIIADLPDKLSFDEYCYLTKAQAAIYQNVVDSIMKDIQSSDGIERKGLIFKLITALKQICNHPAHFANQGAVASDLSGKAAKTVDLLKGILENGEKALIFTQYTEMGDLLVRMIRDELDTDAAFFHGGLPRKKRDEMVRSFQEDRQTRLMILSLKAGGTGLNLTAASNVIHYDLWWNPAVENQATDRAYRIGQGRNVLVHRLITLGTFEEKIDEMIKAKQELANLTVSTGESWITEMSNKQLADIFSLSR